MRENDISSTDRKLLSQILTAGEPGQGVWGKEELSAILRFQLAASLEGDLTSMEADVEANGRLKAILASAGPRIRTFNDLFHHPTPPVELLSFVKDFAKAAGRNPGDRLPAEVATVIYYTAILVARARCGRSISSMDDQAIRAGAQWVAGQPWIDDSTRQAMQLANAIP